VKPLIYLPLSTISTQSLALRFLPVTQSRGFMIGLMNEFSDPRVHQLILKLAAAFKMATQVTTNENRQGIIRRCFLGQIHLFLH
jgi:hypothetical protein